MASSTSIQPSNGRAERYITAAMQKIAEHHDRTARRYFETAVADNPQAAQQVADFYDGLADAADLKGDLGAGQRNRYLAKKFHKKMLPQLMGTPRAQVYARIADDHLRLSGESWGGYSERHVQRALHYYNESLGGHDLVEARAGRFHAYIARLGHTLGRRWYHMGSHFDTKALEGCLTDLGWLLTAPVPVTDTTNTVKAAVTLFKGTLPVQSQGVVLQQIVPGLRQTLLAPALDDDRFKLQDAALEAFSALLRTHPWAAETAFPPVREFTASGQARYSQAKELVTCYAAVLEGNRAYASVAKDDIPLLHRQYYGNHAALNQVLNLCSTFIKQHDAVPLPVTHFVLGEILNIGRGSTETIGSDMHETVRYTIDLLAGIATTYNDMAVSAIDALGEMGIAVDKPNLLYRTTERDRIIEALWSMNKNPNPQIAAAVRAALTQKMGVSIEEVVARAEARELASALPPSLPVGTPSSSPTPPTQPPIVPIPVPRRALRLPR